MMNSSVPPIAMDYPVAFSTDNRPGFGIDPPLHKAIPFLGLIDQLSLTEKVSEEQVFDHDFHLTLAPLSL